MIEHRVVDGRPVSVQWLTAMGKPCEKDDAWLIRLMYDDGETGLVVINRTPKSVQKFNPYHDEQGRFSTKDAANFHSIGGVFDKQRAKAAESSKQRAAAIRLEARKHLEKYVDFDAPIARIHELNARIKEIGEEQAKYGYGWDLPQLRALPVEGEGFGGVSEDEIREAFSAEHSSVYMAMSRSTTLKILGGDTIKNSLETGRGTFKVIGEERAKKEKKFLGVRAEVSDPASFPKYGFVGKKGAMVDQNIVGFGYGGLYLEFSDTVRKRTTVTIGDSFDSNSSGQYRVPAPIDAVGGAQFHGDDSTNLFAVATRGISKFKENKQNRNVRDLAITSPYIEAQVYGRLDTDSIAAIHVESKKDALALQASMRKNGLNIPIKPTNTHTVLKRLSESYIGDWQKVSSKDVANLGDDYIAKGFELTGANVWASGWRSSLSKLNLPKIKAAMTKYPSAKDVPPSLKRELMIEYIDEGRKGSAGTLPKNLHRKASVRDGFTEDVFNSSLLERYPQ